MTQPMQPLYTDRRGVVRFKENAVVSYLLDKGGLTLNDLALVDFPQEDLEQFAQLIGYSLRGFGELHYVSNRTYARAARKRVAALAEPKEPQP